MDESKSLQVKSVHGIPWSYSNQIERKKAFGLGMVWWRLSDGKQGVEIRLEVAVAGDATLTRDIYP